MTACAACPRRGSDKHHPTGTDPDGAHLDPNLVTILCREHHRLIHDDWKTFDLEVLEGPWSGPERVQIRLLRLAASAVRIPGVCSGIEGLPEAFNEWAEDLAA